MSTQQPEALAQECADYATSLRSAANAVKLEGRAPPVSFLRAADLFERAASRITELESQLAQRFDAADMATTAAQGFRDGVSSHHSPTEGPAGWQPIETAPKDGREVLGYTAEVGALVLYWDTMVSETDRWSDGMSMHNWAPTHWQPMPPPPSSAQKD